MIIPYACDPPLALGRKRLWINPLFSLDTSRLGLNLYRREDIRTGGMGRRTDGQTNNSLSRDVLQSRVELLHLEPMFLRDFRSCQALITFH